VWKAAIKQNSNFAALTQLNINELKCLFNRKLSTLAALFYSPVDFTDASDLHQTVVKFIG